LDTQEVSVPLLEYDVVSEPDVETLPESVPELHNDPLGDSEPVGDREVVEETDSLPHAETLEETLLL
jgi:hypothetical protein